ncbi:sigma-70 family RNA polymerase sigma factor [Dinghuibacter silviterrae]|uniref:RNA polymerase sigma-70 factor (ECF subfamily) n=1 Tax=Dinghuibacter silviterrae TaxID=1539049 RepID=A0A4V3GKL2_9BACT|nr:sigma-70 family RNA polymerase sigma factor [Dinghuibacter silviterrae]TDW96082.1 RNA polymerase sigma-70 factor (ECF subfamily) [Dinghuibacter silviterrae]
MDQGLAAIKNGSHEAFVEVYGLLHIKVFRFYAKRVRHDDPAKELTQQCFIRLWEYRHTLSEEHPLEKQVFIIARSVLINYLKKEAVRRKVAPVEEGISNEHAHFELSAHLHAALETLSPVRKKVVMLKSLHGFSNREVADRMNISVKTVEDHITKAFRHLRQVVSSFFF